jgi:hypothetical protein
MYLYEYGRGRLTHGNELATSPFVGTEIDPAAAYLSSFDVCHWNEWNEENKEEE